MKRKFEHPSASEGELSGPRYWRSLGELSGTPGFREQLEREFPDGASNLNGVDRRHFFKIMAASFALGGIGLAGCRRPEAYVLPYGKSIEGVIPGLPQYFATSMPLRRWALPLIAETHQGRPTKLEGNPSFAPSGGASNLVSQASLLDLYDPDRATAHTKNGEVLIPAAVNDLLAAIGAQFAATQGRGLALLTNSDRSPTRSRLLGLLREKFPAAIISEYESVTDTPPQEASVAAFGKSVEPRYRLAKAKRIVSIDADLLHAEAGAFYNAREFAQGRRVKNAHDPMSRLYVVESGLSLTGSMADERLRLASSHMLAFASALAQIITGSSDYATLTKGLDIKKGWVESCAADLLEHKGECLVVAGSHLPASVHVIVAAINAALGNLGKTVDYVAPQDLPVAPLSELVRALISRSVDTLIILGGNPAYNAPADFDWIKLQQTVKNVIRFGYYFDETSAASAPGVTHIAAAHYLESWGDARAFDGTILPVQPMIQPLFGGLTEIEVLARILGLPESDPYTLVHATIASLAKGDTEKAFRRFLHDGYLADSAFKPVSVSFKPDTAAALLQRNTGFVPVDAQNLEVVFVTDHKVDDGRFANNGWLQECPDPITKIAWDNAILVSPQLGRLLGIEPKAGTMQVARKEEAEFSLGKEQAWLGELTVNGRKITGPMHIQPGLSNFTVVIAQGYGRTKSGRVGNKVGFSVAPARTSSAMNFATGAKLARLDSRYALANTQEHWSMEGRDIVREANLDEFEKNPAFVASIGMESHTPPVYGADGSKLSTADKAKGTPRGNSMYETPDFTGTHQWGMSIDLNLCYGCNACVVACQAENNIPIVGKDQVLRGREMHWIRLDRYYSSGSTDNGELPEDPQISLQPMTCQHCELAPCETVCPVNATVHDEEGLNVMAYNRCIGTRYCANNCPYKVRRFNFFDWNKRATDEVYMGPLGKQKEMPELVKMAKNPDVTVRMRGVMEKCTYCVQRIQQAKIAQKVKAGASADIHVRDGQVKTACQQVCPVDAIIFGDIADANSAVSKAKEQPRTYAVLGYLNVRPRTSYLGKLRNPNPKMPGYSEQPLPNSRKEYNDANHPAHGSSAGHGAGEHGQDASHEPKHGGSH